MQASLEDEALRGLDGPQLALDLHHHLGPDLRRVAALRASGAGNPTYSAGLDGTSVSFPSATSLTSPRVS
jgi:hypothetical protein